jgi:hypothetical protein
MLEGVNLSRSRGLENREPRTTDSVETLHTERLVLVALTPELARAGRCASNYGGVRFSPSSTREPHAGHERPKMPDSSNRLRANRTKVQASN